MPDTLTRYYLNTSYPVKLSTLANPEVLLHELLREIKQIKSCLLADPVRLILHKLTQRNVCLEVRENRLKKNHFTTNMDFK